jgi:hypothetical protein
MMIEECRIAVAALAGFLAIKRFDVYPNANEQHAVGRRIFRT